MRRLKLIFGLCASAMLAQQTPATPGGSCAVEGHIRKAANAEPIADASVLLMSTGKNPVAKTATSDAEGHFAFESIDAGDYVISTPRLGTVHDAAGKNVFRCRSGEHQTDLDLAVAEEGSLSGKITGEDGQRPPSASVNLLQMRYVNGVRVLMSSQSTATDADGRYSFQAVPAGRYYISAVPQREKTAAKVEARSESAGPQRTFAQTFYPSSLDVDGAQAVSVKNTGELSSIDIPLLKSDVFRVRGKVIVDADAIGPVDTVGFWPQDTKRFGLAPARMVKVAADGSFDAQALAAGTYVVRTAKLSGREVIDVSKDLNDVTLQLTSPFAVTGHVHLDTGAPAAGLDNYVITLLQTDSPVKPITARVEKDGSLRLNGVMAGLYTVKVSGMRRGGLYTKALQLGTADLPDSVIEIAAPRNDLDVVLGTDGGRVTGVVHDSDGAPVPSAMVVVVPDAPDRGKTFRYVFAYADAHGRFSATGIAPGTYKVFAWKSIPDGAYFDPNVLQPAESDAAAVEISASASATADVKLSALAGNQD